MRKYVKKRQAVIDKTIHLAKLVDVSMVKDAISLTVALEAAEPNEEFVNGMLGFINYASYNKKDVSNSELLSTLLHDLIEFKYNRHHDWFLPRTFRYSQYANSSNKRQSKFNQYCTMREVYNDCLVWIHDKAMYALLNPNSEIRLRNNNIEILYKPQ